MIKVTSIPGREVVLCVITTRIGMIVSSLGLGFCCNIAIVTCLLFIAVYPVSFQPFWMRKVTLTRIMFGAVTVHQEHTRDTMISEGIFFLLEPLCSASAQDASAAASSAVLTPQR